jgi:hypothetical protein
MTINKEKSLKISGLLAYVFLACIFVFFFKPTYLLSILIVLLPPSLINFLWLKNSRAKVFIFSLLSTLIFAPPIELASRLANVWDVQSVLPRFFGLVPLENMLFAFFNFFWVLTFYEYFTDGDTDQTFSKKFRYLIGLYFLEAAIVYVLFFFNRRLVTLNYFSMAAVILIIPATLIFVKKPRLLKKTILPTAFFAIIFFVYEIVSLKIGSWWWPGHYLLPIHLWGTIFPLDDVIIWYLLSTPALIGGYELFMDDWN